MKYLLYYKLDNEFISDQIDAGGDGTKVVSVVDGVAWTEDREKVYYRLSSRDEDISATTLTVHHKNVYGEQVAEDDVINVEYYVGKETTYTVVAKSIEGLSALTTFKTVSVPEVDEYTMYYSDVPLNEMPLTFVINGDGVIRWTASSSNNRKTIQYKKNNGTWTSITSNTGSSAPSISVVAGDKVQFRGNNATYYTDFYYYNCFSGSTCQFSLIGNIMSLINSTNFATLTMLSGSHTFFFFFENCTGLTSAELLALPATTLAQSCYSSMFYGCASLTTAPELPATILASYCYSSMFYGCTSLTIAPELPARNLTQYCYANMFYSCATLTAAPELPARNLAQYCYENMFWGCASLTAAPALPATTLANYCYEGMFGGCTSLTTAPELPATTLASSCYRNMFNMCTNLTIIPSDYLPATTLTNYCYDYMFQACTSLTTAPELPATTLASGCYRGMFYGCTKLNYIKCLATDISASQCTYNWVSGVSSTGTFVKDPSMSSWTRGFSSIPISWTVQDLGDGSVGGCKTKYIFSQDSIENASLEFSAEGNWSASTENEWITLSRTEGIERGKVTLLFNLASASTTRNGEITLKTDINEVEVEIIQNDNLVTPLTFNIVSAGTITWEAVGGSGVYTVTIEYSKDDGNTWTSITSSSAGTSFSVNAGDKVQFRGNNARYSNDVNRYNVFRTTARFNAEGNIMSLINSSDFATITTLASSYTFNQLFSGCFRLMSAENLMLPATTLTSYCYESMFWGCTNLTTAPELPATTLAFGCYDGMFGACTYLTTAPALPATTLASDCYHGMFRSCTTLRTAPELPATTLAGYCYQYMFQGCTSLTTAPELPATTLADYCYDGMFYGTDVLPDCSNIDFTSQTVVQSGGLKGLFAGTKVTDSDLLDILPINQETGKYFLPATALAYGCYDGMFGGCTSLTTAPELPATTLASSCYRNMFYSCTTLTTAPELPATTLADSCYSSMFQACTSLTTAPELPATTLANSCYSYMFYGCTSLTAAPELPATTLANSCYSSMFYGCTSLNYIKCLATDISASNCTNYWVYGVASSGTFEKNPNISSWQTGVDGIPNNWTVTDAS